MQAKPLNPQVAAIAELRHGLRATRVLEAGALRDAILPGIAATNSGGPQPKSQREIGVPRADDSTIRIVLYEPEQARGLCILFHGGGFVICSPETHDKIARTLAIGASCTVASVDYRLAPEYPFPAALDDAITAADWLAANLAPSAEPIVLAGDSAGGNLALQAALHLASTGRTPRGLLLLYPWLELGRDSESRRRFGPDDMIIDDEFMDYCTRCYVPGANISDPRVSPLFGDLEGLPNTAVVCGSLDPLLSDSEALVERQRAQGMPVSWHLFDGMPHGFVSMNNAIDDGQKALDLAARLVSQMVEGNA